ncbi:MAG: NusG domain II-containing protein [Clostridia bacterium]
MMHRADGWLLLAVVLCAGVVMGWMHFRAPKAMEAVVTQDGVVCARFALSQDAVWETAGNRVVLSGGTVRMESADCPDQRCVRQGAVCRTGEQIICLPHRLVVTLQGEEDARKMDAVSQ